VADLVTSSPLISVMIPSYNYLHYITAAIDSVRAQTYPNVEIIVSDNRSTDGTVAALRARYEADPRVKVFENDTNVGMIGNFNVAYARAAGAFVLWLSADDWLLPRHLERLAAVFAREPQIDVVYSGALFCDADGRIYGMRQMPGQFPVDYVDARDELVEMLTTTCPLCWPTALFRRELFEELGLFDVDGPLASDWDVQVRFALAGKKFAYLHEPTTVVRLHGNQITGNEYHVSGHNVMDFVEIVERALDHPGMARMRGREATMARFVGALADGATAMHGSNPFTVDDRARIAELQATLHARAALYEPARARDWLVSVIIVTQGPLAGVLRAIDSVAAQSDARWELVVVDQNPIPLAEILRAHPAWPRMKYVRLPVARTPGAARNLGARMAAGELHAYLEESDTFDPGHLASLVATIARTGSEVAVASSRLVLERIAPRGTHFEELGVASRVYRDAGDLAELSAIASALPLGALLAHRRLRESAGGFNETLPVLDEFEYLLRIERATRLTFSGEETYAVHATLGLLAHPLGARLGPYLPVLDGIYNAYPDATVAGYRTRHRAAVEAALANAGERSGNVQQLADLFATLAGRAAMPVAVG
jgi:glycosyltransferase involved in cell wall biosynthesis